MIVIMLVLAGVNLGFVIDLVVDNKPWTHSALIAVICFMAAVLISKNEAKK